MTTHALRRILLLVLILAVPAHGATWQPLGPDGGRVPALVADPLDPDVVYAGTFGGGLFRSTDGGRSWEGWSQGVTDLYVLSLAAGPDGTLYAGTFGGGVFRREPGEGSWEPANGALPRRFHPPCECHPEVAVLAVDPVSGALYAGLVGHTVHRSIDGGETWAGVASGITGFFRDLAVDPRGSLYIATDHGLYRSDDGGSNAVRLLHGPRRAHITAIVFDPASPDTVYAATLDERGDGVLKSTDRGKTWRPARAGLRNRQVLDLAIDPNRPRTLYASTRAGVFRTDDGGGKWRKTGRGLPGTQASALRVAGSSVLAGMDYADLYGATGPAVFRSDDRGARWSRSDAGIAASNVGSVAFANGAVFAGTAGQGLLRREGEGWVGAGVPGAEVHALLADSGLLLAATSAGLFRNGERITPADPRTNRPADVRSLALGAGGSLLAGGKEWIFKSDDRGESWRAVDQARQTWIEVLAVDPASPQTAFAGGTPVDFRVIPPAVKSTDGGETWVQTGALPWLQALAIDRGVVYASSLENLQRSRDQGRTWETIPPPAGTNFLGVTALAVDSKGVLYAAFSGILGIKPGVYRMNGSSWELVGEGLRNAYVLTLQMDAAGDLYSGTQGGGLWRLDP